MPPSDAQIDEVGWRYSSELQIPPQRLEKGEVDAFLQFVFEDVAHKPAELVLREGVAAAGYLQRVADKVEGSGRKLLPRISILVWRHRTKVGKTRFLNCDRLAGLAFDAASSR